MRQDFRTFQRKPPSSVELLSLAESAFAAGAVDLAIDICQVAVQAEPSRRTVTQLATYVAAAGEAARVIGIYRAMTDELGLALDARSALALGLANAELGNFRLALDYLWRVVSFGEESDELWFYIGTCYAMLGQFAAADRIFERGIVLPLLNGRTTSTSLLRLSSANSPAGPPSFPFSRTVVLGDDLLVQDERIAGVRCIHFVCCDSRYFQLFGRAVTRSLAEQCGSDIGLHFHLVNTTDVDRKLLQRLRSDYGTPLAASHEQVELGELTSDQIGTYYTCARFLLLPDLLNHYQKPVLITDADQIVVRPLTSFLKNAETHDVGLLIFPRASYNLMALISASVCTAMPNARARSFFCKVRDYIVARMAEPKGMSWHLDQAALAVAYLTVTDVNVWRMPTDTMISKIAQQSTQNTNALFWSATYSVMANAEKLETPEFRALAS